MTHSPVEAESAGVLESDEWLTTTEAAALLKVHEDTIRKAIAEKRLPHLELGPKTFRISRAALLELGRAGIGDGEGVE
ncbi:MAG TPA: helix-turn-helix domain-containing protein [Acidimicrobiia bacterium]